MSTFNFNGPVNGIKNLDELINSHEAEIQRLEDLFHEQKHEIEEQDKRIDKLELELARMAEKTRNNEYRKRKKDRNDECKRRKEEQMIPDTFI
jgi:predicted nuclease with TOPRIM domain